MASAKPGVHVLQLKPIAIPDALVRGEKALKWDEETGSCFLCTLKVDAKGFCLYWIGSRTEECSFIDVAFVRDARTGKSARLPRESRVREQCAAFLGRAPTEHVHLEEATLNICTATDLVNVTWHNFICLKEGCAKMWATEVLSAAYNQMALNGSVLSFLEKTYTKLTLCSVDFEGNVPIKSIAKLLNLHRDDRKRLEKALEELRSRVSRYQRSSDASFVSASQLSFDDFFGACMQLTRRNDIDAVFHDIGAKKKPYLTSEQFRDFLNNEQRDPRLNEILYPYASLQKAEELIQKYERNASFVSKGHLSQDAFMRFLLGEDNIVVPMEKYDLSDDMTQPLAHYFINSSHNTYLTGHQLKSPSSVEIYRQVLLSGCRCIELDIWNGGGADEEPIITHGYTLCTEILFKDVVEAIADTAFKTSEYPVILSFENHCNTKQQAKMAAYCKQSFGDMLLAAPVDSFPLEPGHCLPSPEMLKRRIIIKNKKKHAHHHHQAHNTSSALSDGSAMSGAAQSPVGYIGDRRGVTPSSSLPLDDGEVTPENLKALPDAKQEEEPEGADSKIWSSGNQATQSPLPSTALSVALSAASSSRSGGIARSEDIVSGSESDSEDEEATATDIRDMKPEVAASDQGTAAKEAEAGDELSSLVNYVTPVHFHTFEVSEKRNRSHEISSFVETQALLRLKEKPVEFVNYNKRQMSRIYPKGARIDSSNFMPQVFWNAGCQLVALNFQSLDLPMQINLGQFEYNGRSGYILKPDFMRRKDRHFDPFSESTVDGIVAGTLSIQIISGQFLSDKKCGTYVEVEMYGLPADTVRRRFRTRTVPLNGLNPLYDEKAFVFQKVILPNLAMIRIAVNEETGRLIGQRLLPMESVRPGYRHISLRNEYNQPLVLPSLFVHITVKDYVPDQYLDFANALANPIAYQSMLAKHAEQLAVLTEDFDGDSTGTGVSPSLSSAPALPLNSPMEDSPCIAKKDFVHRQSRELVSNQSSTSSYTKKQQIIRTESVPLVSAVGVQQRAVGWNGSPSSTLSRQRGAPSRSMGNLASSTLPREVSAPLALDTVATQEKFNALDTLRGPTMEELQKKPRVLKVAAKKKKALHKLGLSAIKRVCSLEEAHAVERQKAARSLGVKQSLKKTCGGPPASLQLSAEQALEYIEVMKRQASAIVTEYQELFSKEKELHLKFHGQYKVAVRLALSASHVSQQKRLRELHEDEDRNMRRLLSVQRKAGARNISRTPGADKDELARLKVEFEQVVVKDTVKVIQWLQELVEKGREEIDRSNMERKIELEHHFSMVENHFVTECNRKSAEQETRLRQQLAADTDCLRAALAIKCCRNKSDRVKAASHHRSTVLKWLQECEQQFIPDGNSRCTDEVVVPSIYTKL